MKLVCGMSRIITHYPKGEMCIGCTKLFDDCSMLPFKDMHILEKGEENMVRCRDYDRSKQPRKPTGRSIIAKRRKEL